MMFITMIYLSTEVTGSNFGAIGTTFCDLRIDWCRLKMRQRNPGRSQIYAIYIADN